MPMPLAHALGTARAVPMESAHAMGAARAVPMQRTHALGAARAWPVRCARCACAGREALLEQCPCSARAPGVGAARALPCREQALPVPGACIAWALLVLCPCIARALPMRSARGAHAQRARCPCDGAFMCGDQAFFNIYGAKLFQIYLNIF